MKLSRISVIALILSLAAGLGFSQSVELVGAGLPLLLADRSIGVRQMLEHALGSDAMRLQKLSERYLRQTTEQFAKLRDAIATGDAPDVKRIAHSAAGSSAMCGMNPMVALLRELERMGQMGQLADAPRVYARVKDEFTRISQFFRDHIEAATSLKG